MKRLRLAIIGAGHLGRIHTRLASTLDQIELAAVVDPVGALRRQLADEYRTTALASYQPLLGRIDAAIVATPTQHHHSVAMDLIRNGVHVLVEKPLATTSAECVELVGAAHERSVVLQVGHVERFNPAIEAVLPGIRNPKYIDAVRTSGYTFRSTDIGAVLDIMIHDLDLVLSMVKSDVADVHALGISVFGGHEDMAQARLHFTNGSVANLTASRCSFKVQRRMQIFFETGFASIDFASCKATVVRPDERLLRREIDFERLPPDDKQHIRDNLFQDLLPREEITAQPHNAILQEQLDFLDSIRTGKAPRVDGLQGLLAISVAERILEKIATHRWTSDGDGPLGAMATHVPRILPGVFPATLPPDDAAVHRKAG